METFTESVLVVDVLGKLVGTMPYSTGREELYSRSSQTVSQARVPPGSGGISRGTDRPNRGAGRRQRWFKSVPILFTI